MNSEYIMPNQHNDENDSNSESFNETFDMDEHQNERIENFESLRKPKNNENCQMVFENKYE